MLVYTIRLTATEFKVLEEAVDTFMDMELDGVNGEECDVQDSVYSNIGKLQAIRDGLQRAKAGGVKEL